MNEGIDLKKEVQVPVLSKEEHVWLQAWLCVARSDNCTRSQVAVMWADDCLKEFKERFGSSKK